MSLSGLSSCVRRADPFIWCAICRRPVKCLDSRRYDLALEMHRVVRCPGLTKTIVFGEEVFIDYRRFEVVAFERPPLALPPIAPPAPPRVRGRHLPPPDASRTTVYHAMPRYSGVEREN